MEPTLLAELEAVLMVIEEPATVHQLAVAVDSDVAEVQRALTVLAADYDGHGSYRQRGFQLREIAGGWRVYSRTKYAAAVERFLVDGGTTRLSQAALEALSVVAYLQPATRTQVAAIRGVNSDSVMRTLHARGLISESGQEPQTGAVLYCTTAYFLEVLGLDSIEELPKLSPLLPGLADIAEIDGYGEH